MVSCTNRLFWLTFYFPRRFFCNDEISQSVFRLLKKTAEDGKIPERGEIIKEVGNAAKGFIRDPVGSVRRGFQREKLFREAHKDFAGVDAPGKMQVTKTAMKSGSKKMAEFAKNNPDAVRSLVVNTGGFTGSVIGGVAGGKAGQLAGDYLGARIVRKGVTDLEATRNAIRNLNTDKAFKDLNPLIKLKKTIGASLSELKLMEESGRLADDLVDDCAGWAVGNATAETIG